jgi:NAD(P)-dependent dehydrogenase (short-subunit alcohol dehydrogenase family)
MAMSIDLGGRPCLVVGGAGGGIGTAMALAAAGAGAAVGVITNLEDHRAEIEDALRARQARFATAVADVTEERHLSDAIAAIAEQLGPIHHLVNVVGGNLVDDYHPAAASDMTAFDRVVARNLRYAVVACREVARPLLGSGETGSIVNVSSAASRGAPLLGAYAAAKAGLEAYSRTMALEWAPSGIRVNVVSVGAVRTPRTGLGEDPESVTGAIPLRRRGDASEVATAAMFLLSDLASYVTGQTLLVDGGVTLGHRGGVELSNFVTRADVRARFAEEI